MRNKTIFVAHPISGDVEGNLRKVAEICKAIYQEGHIPIFPSHTARQYLDDGPELKELCGEVNEEYFQRGMVDEVRFYGDRMSDGMKAEAILAHQFGVILVSKSEATRAALKELGFFDGDPRTQTWSSARDD